MKTVAALLGFLLSTTLWGAEVVREGSYVRFISVKKNAVAEVGGFGRFAGTLSSEGEFRLDVDLSSVSTLVEIRDQRMVRFPAATVVGQVDMARVGALAAGQELVVPVTGSLGLHGAEQKLQADVRIVRLADGALRASTVNPVLLSLKDFGLEEGVDKLQALAELPSITRVVPVYFSLLLK